MGCDSERLSQQSSRCVPRKEIVYLSMIFVGQTIRTKEKAYIYINEDSKGFLFTVCGQIILIPMYHPPLSHKICCCIFRQVPQVLVQCNAKQSQEPPIQQPFDFFFVHIKIKCIVGMPGEAEATEKSLVRTSLCKTPIPLHYLPMLHHTHPHKHRMLTPRYQKRMKDSSSTQACHYVRLHGYCTKSMVNSQKEVNPPSNAAVLWWFYNNILEWTHFSCRVQLLIYFDWKTGSYKQVTGD